MYESLAEHLRYWGACFPGYTLRTACEAKQAIVDIIEDAPTIIPAEEDER